MDTQYSRETVSNYTPIRKPTRSSTVCTEGTTTSKRRRRKNRVNQLPPEVLSYIMRLAVESYRKTWNWGSSGMGPQQIASHVCRYWREVATGTPALWSVLLVRSAPLSKRATLSLSRAGPSTPLDVVIDLPRNVNGPRAEQDWELFTQIIHSIIGHGAHTNRWHSLFIRTGADHAKIISIFASFTSQHPVPSLERIRIDCEKPGRDAENAYVSFGLSLSNMRHLELVSPPSQLTFLMTPELTRLSTLSIASREIDSTQISNLLRSHPQLEALWLDDGARSLDSDQTNFGHIERTHAPSLRSLYIQTRLNTSWALRMLIAIKAPELVHFGLQCSNKTSDLMGYVITGVRSANSTKSDSAGDPIYPSLEGLDIHNLSCQEDKFKHFVSSFPLLTRLTVCAEQVGWFHTTPWMLPKLQFLRVTDSPVNHDGVMELLSRRIDLNLSIKEIEAQKGYLKLGGPQHVPLSSEGHRLSVALAYEFYQDGDGVIEYDPHIRPLAPPRLQQFW